MAFVSSLQDGDEHQLGGYSPCNVYFQFLIADSSVIPWRFTLFFHFFFRWQIRPSGMAFYRKMKELSKASRDSEVPADRPRPGKQRKKGGIF